METAWVDWDQDLEVEARHRTSAYEAGPLLELELVSWWGRVPAQYNGWGPTEED